MTMMSGMKMKETLFHSESRTPGRHAKEEFSIILIPSYLIYCISCIVVCQSEQPKVIITVTSQKR